MKIALGVGVAFVAVVIGFLSLADWHEKTQANADPGSVTHKRAVLVELFTSEGCSSCPPADRLLTEISKQNFSGVEPIVLAFHVDYWDRLGWKDRFSSADHSRRQEAYGEKFKLGSIYTPQMVVNGEKEFVGNNRVKANENIARAVADTAGSADVELKDGKLNIEIRDLPRHNGANVYLAVAENGLTTNVGAGENSGSRLEHNGVVRQLAAIGTIKSGDNSFAVAAEVPSNTDWNAANLRFVVFAQEKESLKVLAVAAAR